MKEKEIHLIQHINISNDFFVTTGKVWWKYSYGWLQMCDQILTFTQVPPLKLHIGKGSLLSIMHPKQSPSHFGILVTSSFTSFYVTRQYVLYGCEIIPLLLPTLRTNAITSNLNGYLYVNSICHFRWAGRIYSVNIVKKTWIAIAQSFYLNIFVYEKKNNSRQIHIYDPHIHT